MLAEIGALAGSVMNYMSQKDTNEQSAKNVQAQNAANIAQQGEAQRFNAEQAALNRQFQYEGQQSQQAYGSSEAAKQMGFQREMVEGQQAFQRGSVEQQQAFQQQMSNTAYQRAAADMKAAGLNPMMMFGHGAAASSPGGSFAPGASASGASGSSSGVGGSSASVSPARMEAQQYHSPLAAFSNMLEKVISNQVQVKYMDKMSEEIASMKVRQGKEIAETSSELKRPGLLESQTDLNKVEAIAKKLGLPIIQNAAETSKNELSMNSTFRRWLEMSSKTGRGVSDLLKPVTEGVKAVRGGQRIYNTRYGSGEGTYYGE